MACAGCGVCGVCGVRGGWVGVGSLVLINIKLESRTMASSSFVNLNQACIINHTVANLELG